LDGLPYRILDDFIITDAETNPKGLEELAKYIYYLSSLDHAIRSNHDYSYELQGTGRVVDPNDDDKPLEQRGTPNNIQASTFLPWYLQMGLRSVFSSKNGRLNMKSRLHFGYAQRARGIS
jgi:hypothetical protein